MDVGPTPISPFANKGNFNDMKVLWKMCRTWKRRGLCFGRGGEHAWSFNSCAL